MYSRIAGTGSYLPDKVVTNFDLEKKMDTTDEWIRTRTGIERRHIAAEGQTTVDLAEQAARRAIEAAGVTPAEIDLIVRCFRWRPLAAVSSTRCPSPTNS
jgi:3-oxoacyl-[acyl-carrier-protein] synthase-3